jgi:hypothetical protein
MLPPLRAGLASFPDHQSARRVLRHILNAGNTDGVAFPQQAAEDWMIRNPQPCHGKLPHADGLERDNPKPSDQSDQNEPRMNQGVAP